MKILFITILSILATACTPRSEVFPNAPNNVQFSKPVLVNLPESSSYAEKRKFIDINCDGIEDMLEVSDTVLWGQEYQAIVFLGKKNKQGLLEFDNTSRYTFDIPMEKSWSSSLTKIDSADVNGDSCGDLVFTEYKEGLSEDSYVAKVAINQGDGKTFKFATDKMVEKVSFEESILRIIAAFDDAYGGGESITDYFAIDWADVNNDGRDDLMLFWTDYSDLYISTLLSVEMTSPLDSFSFQFGGDHKIINFMHSRTGSFNYGAYNIDTEDFNGDGYADIIIHNDSSNNIELLPALFDPQRQRYIVQKGHYGKTTDLDFFSFEKKDHLDVNFDGCADNVHLGVYEKSGQEDRSVGSYKISACPSYKK
jgi:hypothetical protein